MAGARQKSGSTIGRRQMKGEGRSVSSDSQCFCSMGRLFSLTFPEVLEAAAQYRATKGYNGVGSSHGPVHACTLQSCADGKLAACFDNAGRGAEALRMECRIAHPATVLQDVVATLSRLLAG